MSATESQEMHQEEAQNAANFLRSLGNPHRLQILCRLALGEQSVGQLHQFFDLSPSAFSQHLAVLRQQQLVSIRKESQTVYYSIKDPDTEAFMTLLKDKFCPSL
ncbi:ArsR/SmtB family transcription factor [Idiomarina sp. ST20R2A10]|uniref:ArsR/SmtB family transcription factor n=1 Tax=Idiomarina sp. ST20R2A10 TaxID=3418369 RepID=UPI003EC90064